jgi:predicted transcriptional regulator
MQSIPLTPGRQAELEKFAQEHGQSPADTLDEAVATYLEWRRQDYQEAVEGIRGGYEDVRAGRTRPVREFFNDMRRKHGISG